MPLPAGAHVKIGEKHYRLDESQEAPYRRFSRSIFADIPLVGTAGQNLQPGRLVWNQTNFDGEGQVVLDITDSSSARRFYRSSGLDFKTAGQFALNRASELTVPSASSGTPVTLQGNADMSNVVGTSTANPLSTDGVTWTSQTSGTANNVSGIAWSVNEAQFVAVGASGTVLTSPDASTWTARTSNTAYTLEAVARSEGDDLWVGVGSTGTVITSSNGSSWSAIAAANYKDLKAVARSDAEDLWVAVGADGSIWSSPDGTTWTSRTSGISSSETLRGVARSEADDLWVVVGTTGTITTSTNGTSWTSRTSGTTKDLYAVAYYGSLWVAVGRDGTILTSANGTSWTSQTSNSTASLYGIVNTGGTTWIAVGTGGTILTSPDGVTWTSRTSGVTSVLNAVASGPAILKTVTVGNSGVIRSTSGSGDSTTDRQLNAINDVIKGSSNHTPGAYTVSVVLHGYRSTAINVAGQSSPTVTLSVYNVTDSSTVSTTTATLSSTTTSAVASISFGATAAKDYSYRVTWSSGTGYKPIVDKIVYTVATTSAVYTYQSIELGQGGSVWVGASSTTASTDTTTHTYDFSGGTWTNRVTPSTTNNKKPLAMAHTDKYEYVLLDNSVVYQATTSVINPYIAATTATARGIAVTQNRLFVLGEDSTNGVIVYLYAIDGTALPVSETSSVTVDNGKNSPDASLRQRMTSSPNGALFFVNYSTRGVIYECDASDASPVVSILAELPEGVKATSILHTGGLTFVAGQFLAPTGATSRSALFMIDQNGVIQRIGWFRRDDPNANPVIAMQAYQNDLWMLQGGLVWRYSLTTGGLFLEHELPAASPSSARGIAVTQDYVFAAYDSGVYVVGHLTNYITAQTASIISSVYDFGLPYEEKLLQTIEVTTNQLPANTAIQVEYQVNQNGVWVNAGTSRSGTLHKFLLSDASYATRFHTLQIRTTPSTVGGTSTPVVKGVTVQCYTTTTEELFDLALLTTDQDSETTLAGDDLNGSELAANIWELASAGSLVTLLDGYSTGPYEEPREFLCKIESVDHINVSPSEGSVRVRLRVVT